MTLEKIRAALPTHIMLTPGVHMWREGDKCPNYLSGIPKAWIGKKVEPYTNNMTSFRPIPTHILDNQALWLWLQTLEGIGSAPPMSEIVEADLLPEWKNLLTKGRLYDKWLLEQMEGV